MRALVIHRIGGRSYGTAMARRVILALAVLLSLPQVVIASSRLDVPERSSVCLTSDPMREGVQCPACRSAHRAWNRATKVDGYAVLLVKEDGSAEIYAGYPATE
jgi:hypothetical protein